MTSHRTMARAQMTPSLQRRAQHSMRTWGTPESLWPSAIQAKGVEHLWSPAGATGGNQWQMGHPRKPLKQADPQLVATHGNGFEAHGKEGVNGSSPLEGFRLPGAVTQPFGYTNRFRRRRKATVPKRLRAVRSGGFARHKWRFLPWISKLVRRKRAYSDPMDGRRGRRSRRSKGLFAGPNLGRDPLKPTTANTPSIVVDDWVGKRGLADGESRRVAFRDSTVGAVHELAVSRTSNLLNCILVTEQRGGRRTRRAFEVRVFQSSASFSARRVFVCPNGICSALTRTLYLSGDCFVCRTCAKLLYPSQLMSDSDRRRRRAKKIRQQLGPPEQKPGLPTRPKGMHQTTFERLLDELADLDVAVQAMLEQDVSALLMLGLGAFEVDDDWDQWTGYRYPEFKRTRKTIGLKGLDSTTREHVTKSSGDIGLVRGLDSRGYDGGRSVAAQAQAIVARVLASMEEGRGADK